MKVMHSIIMVINGYNPRNVHYRPIVLGRKAGSVAGGERTAVIYTLLGTAKLNGLNPTHI